MKSMIQFTSLPLAFALNAPAEAATRMPVELAIDCQTGASDLYLPDGA